MDKDMFLGSTSRLAGCDVAYVLRLVKGHDGVRVVARCVKDRYGNKVGVEHTLHTFRDSGHIIYGAEG